MLCDTDLGLAPMREPEYNSLLAIRRELQPHQPVIDLFRAIIVIPVDLQLINLVQLMSCGVCIRYNKQALAIGPKFIPRDLNLNLKKMIVPRRLQLTFPVPLCQWPNCRECPRKISCTPNNYPLKKKCPCLVNRKHSLHTLECPLARAALSGLLWSSTPGTAGLLGKRLSCFLGKWLCPSSSGARLGSAGSGRSGSGSRCSPPGRIACLIVGPLLCKARSRSPRGSGIRCCSCRGLCVLLCAAFGCRARCKPCLPF